MRVGGRGTVLGERRSTRGLSTSANATAGAPGAVRDIGVVRGNILINIISGWRTCWPLTGSWRDEAQARAQAGLQRRGAAKRPPETGLSGFLPPGPPNSPPPPPPDTLSLWAGNLPPPPSQSPSLS